MRVYLPHSTYKLAPPPNSLYTSKRSVQAHTTCTVVSYTYNADHKGMHFKSMYTWSFVNLCWLDAPLWHSCTSSCARTRWFLHLPLFDRD